VTPEIPHLYTPGSAAAKAEQLALALGECRIHVLELVEDVCVPIARVLAKVLR
jgi:hypothetical protein